MNKGQHDDDRDLSDWLFQRRRPQHQGRVWTSASSNDRKREK